MVSTRESDALGRVAVRASVLALWVVILVGAAATYALRRSEALHAIDNGVADAAASLPASLAAVPLATVAAVLVLRARAVLLGVSLLAAAVLLAISRFGDAALAFASPAPLGLSGYGFPGLGTVVVVGRVAGIAGLVVLSVGSAASLGAQRLDRRSRLALRLAGGGVGLVAVGVATTPEPIIASFSSAIDSPLALPNFEAAASTLRLLGLLVCVVATAVAALGYFDRLRSVERSALQPLRLLGAAVGSTAISAVAGFVAGVALLRPVAAGLALIGLPAVVGFVGERLHGLTPGSAEGTTRAQTESSFETLATRVLAVGRVASALWAFALFTAFRESFDGAIPGLLLSIAVLLSAVAAVNAVRPVIDWRALCAVEVLVAAGLMFADGASSGNGHLFSGAAGLGGPWPTVVVAAAGAAGGIAVGLAAGAVVGAARVAGVLASGEVVFAAQGQGLAGGVVGLIVVGLASGALLAALREAERRIASARAREAVARRLHDGVLQALAIVRRRSKDADLVALVADADRDLRAFLDRGDAEGELDLENGLRQAVDECERRFGLAVVVVVDDLPRRVSSDVSAAVIGALSEALANVSKHAGVKQATVFAGVDDENGFYVSVTDRGVGFDPGAFAPGRGLSGSVNGRMHEVGGSATVRPLKGGGTQVMLCLP